MGGVQSGLPEDAHTSSWKVLSDFSSVPLDQCAQPPKALIGAFPPHGWEPIKPTLTISQLVARGSFPDQVLSLF